VKDALKCCVKAFLESVKEAVPVLVVGAPMVARSSSQKQPRESNEMFLG
jgi:hypothetical protein